MSQLPSPIILKGEEKRKAEEERELEEEEEKLKKIKDINKLEDKEHLVKMCKCKLAPDEPPKDDNNTTEDIKNNKEKGKLWALGYMKWNLPCLIELPRTGTCMTAGV